MHDVSGNNSFGILGLDKLQQGRMVGHQSKGGSNEVMAEVFNSPAHSCNFQLGGSIVRFGLGSPSAGIHNGVLYSFYHLGKGGSIS